MDYIVEKSEHVSKKRRLMDNLVMVSVVLMAFYLGIYYSTVQFEDQLQVWDSNYQIITDKVLTFEKVSDPQTIRSYVKELNKILDDIRFLSKMVESGQLADEALTTILDEQVAINQKLLDMVTLPQHNELRRKFREQAGMLMEEVDDNLLAIHDLQEVDSLQIELSDLRDAQIKIIEDEIDSLEVKLNVARETFFGKYIFTE